ncbi:pyridoxal-dependent decarboxylase [Methylosinus sp. R-45379]|uniref:pyridoxal phosphate-dependent decarboxylase family protein n=1 Tax=Methylosinus sp. R-45379 TaxID=980563 RepID=UPI0007C902A5|nr:aminotransferase class V-fold PLP-dependent enzyme [Methylosinus sp. R-45379]OAI30879.1 pyridoxal-dependent decarboxylase [Methylosinus sp. R-45379]
MSKALDHAYRAATAWIDGLDERPVAARATRDDLTTIFGGPLPELGTRSEEVVEWLTRHAGDGLLGSAGGRFFAWVIGGGVESALAADWMVSTWDQNAALYACSPAASVIEDVAGAWIKELLDLPRESSFAFTTGCQLAHTTCLAAARHALLKRAECDVEQDGLFGAPRLTILASEERHGSIDRAARFLGLGRRAIQPLATDDAGRIAPTALEQAISRSAGPAILVLNAADLNIGACDQFAELIPMAHSAGLWVHIDGAFGLFARASRAHRHRLSGVELADSWATDGHKWLNVPFDCGIAIVRDRAAHRAAMTTSAAYIAAQSDARDQIDWNPEWSRRARGVPVYAALKELGREGVEALVDRCCAHCEALVDGLGALAGVEVLSPASLNQGLVRFNRIGDTPEENDAFTDEIIEKINATGEAFFSGTTWRGRRAMRISVVNWRTSESDVDRAVAAARAALAQSHAGSSLHIEG